MAATALKFTRLRHARDVAWAAGLMADSEPWLTLGRGLVANRKLLRNPAKECQLVRVGRVRAGVLVLDPHAPLGGYLQAICVAPAFRGQGLGTAMVQWAEERLFAVSPNVFLCVSSFNHAAARLYRRLGYVEVGNLREFILPGHDEILLRKTHGPLSSPTSPKPLKGSGRRVVRT